MISRNCLFSAKIGNVTILGLIHYDELIKVFKWTPEPKFLHILCVTIVALFPLYLLCRLHFIIPNIIFKFVHVFKPFIPVNFFLVQCCQLRKIILGILIISLMHPLFHVLVAISSFFLILVVYYFCRICFSCYLYKNLLIFICQKL